MRFTITVGLVFLLQAATLAADPAPDSKQFFAIEVIDEQTNRPVPMVELQTTNSASYYTDSAGVVAFNEPGLMNQKVFFSVSSHGYEFPKDGFGSAGVTLETKPGASAQIKIKRINIAERLYRMTGAGIYRDTILLGRKPPIDQPLLNAQITGQDGILNAIYQGKVWWMYGDTLKLSYLLGNFYMSAATSDLPEKLDPEKGIPLKYFTTDNGEMKPMVPMKGEGVVWLYGVVVLPDDTGRERMLAFFQRRRGLEATLEQGFVIYNDEKQIFEQIKEIPLDAPFYPRGYPSRAMHKNGEFIYFTAPYPSARVRATMKDYLDLAKYEFFTCYKPGTEKLDRNADGKLIWEFKADTPPMSAQAQDVMINSHVMTREEIPHRLEDADTHKPIKVNNSSVFFNDYRKKFIMIACEEGGDTTLGEIWFAESEKIEGPWISAKKIITHANKPNDAHDFYNPTQHPFLDREGGKVIYLEGSYVNTFSGNKHPTPWYEYNQIMYRLDLSDERLKFEKK